MKRFAAIITFSFSVFLIFYACTKEYSLENGDSKNIASTGTLKDSSGNCFPDSVVGTYYNGVVPGSDTAYVLLTVNVASTGTYNITTDAQNGFSFSDSGYFNTTGINVIKLKPAGKPILPIVTDFAVKYDTSVCVFSINVIDSTGHGVGGGGDSTGSGGDTTGLSLNTWAFESDASLQSGPVTSAVFDTTIINILSISGTTPGGDSLLFLNITFPATNIDTGTYVTGLANGFLYSTLSGTVIYKADAGTGTNQVEIHIINYDAVNKIVTGSLFGKAEDGSGNAVFINKGVFKAKVI